ncbi:MAG: hypothetical protein IT314_01055 [Anaerolineales bacterium]|nr:hypothetical protein [Anaerolineales bacterium]
MTETLRVPLLIVLLAVAFACYFLVVDAFFNKRVLKTINAAKRLPARSFGIGFVNFLFFGTIAIVLFAVADGVGNDAIRVIVLIPSLALTTLLVIFLSLGLSAMVNILGERIFPDFPAWKKTFWGTVILTFASSIPFVGWFLLLPFISITGFGAVILGFFQKGE